MIAYLLTYSGLAAALTTIFFILLPSLFLNLDYKNQPISLTGLHPKLGIIFNLGLALTSILLSMHIVSLSLRFHIGFISIGPVFYQISNISMLLVAFYPYNAVVHTLWTNVYFVFSLIGSFMFSLTLHNQHQRGALIGLILIGATGIGITLLHSRFKLKSYTEYWGIVGAILWSTQFYFI